MVRLSVFQAKYYDIQNKNDIDGKQLIETLYEFYSDKSNWSKQSVPIGVIEPGFEMCGVRDDV